MDFEGLQVFGLLTLLYFQKTTGFSELFSLKYLTNLNEEFNFWKSFSKVVRKIHNHRPTRRNMTWSFQKPSMEATTKITSTAKKEDQPVLAQVDKRVKEAHVQG